MVRSVGAVGTFVLGLHKKREKVHHPGLQHVTDHGTDTEVGTSTPLRSDASTRVKAAEGGTAGSPGHRLERCKEEVGKFMSEV